NAFLFLAALEQNKGRNTADAIAIWHSLIFVHVHLINAGLAAEFLRHGLNRWPDDPARTTPFRPKIHEYRVVGTKYICFKIRVCDFLCKCSHYDLLIIAKL